MIPATIEKYRLHGTCCGLGIDQTFDDEDAAEDRNRQIDELGDKARLRSRRSGCRRDHLDLRGK